MPPGARMLVVLGAISLLSALIIALALGGGGAPGVFPPKKSVEMKLIPVERLPDVEEATAPPPSPRMEIPKEFRTSDQTPPVAFQGPDGVWRFRD